MADDQPYESPKSDVSAFSCPRCEAEMETGCLYSLSSIRWLGDKDPKLKRFLGGSRLTGNASMAGRVAGHRCAACQMIVLIELEP